MSCWNLLFFLSLLFLGFHWTLGTKAVVGAFSYSVSPLIRLHVGSQLPQFLDPVEQWLVDDCGVVVLWFWGCIGTIPDLPHWWVLCYDRLTIDGVSSILLIGEHVTDGPHRPSPLFSDVATQWTAFLKIRRLPLRKDWEKNESGQFLVVPTAIN